MKWNKNEEDSSELPDIPSNTRPFSKNVNPKIIENYEDNEHIESISSSEKNNLPSFPDSPMSKGFSQSAIKDAVSNGDEKIPLPPKEESFDHLTSEAPHTPSIHSQQNTFIQPNPFINNPILEEVEEPEALKEMKEENQSNMIQMPNYFPEDAPHPPSINKPKIIQQIKPIKKEINETEDNDDFDKYRSPQIREKNSDVFIKIDKFYSAKKALNSIKQDIKDIEDLLSKIRETKIKEERELSTWEKNIQSVKADITKASENLFDKSI